MALNARTIQRLLIGKPLRTEDAPHQSISKKVGLAVFASDALSSVAYATQEILLVLAVAGAAFYFLSIPISLIIGLVLLMLTISYRQTLYAYPRGGGAFIVSRDNLGEVPAMTAAAALLTDYILTVAVSVSSGVEQIVSLLPALETVRVPLAVGLVAVITLINMRGVKESGAIFSVPTYFFVSMMVLLLVVGAARLIAGTLEPVTGIEPHHTGPIESLTLLLVLRAFSSGCAALTGVEAISDGILAFKEPRSHNAAVTLTVMSVILGTFFVGITLLALAVQVVPSELPTVISQVARQVFDGSPALYAMFIAAATLILIMAANTSFADFPRLAAFAAADGYLPRQLGSRGSRLVYTGGVVLLAVASSALIIVFNARVTALIPLYAVGVFLGFTLSQAGMVSRWRRVSTLKPGETIKSHFTTITYDPHWHVKMIVNAVGAATTLAVLLVIGVSKFTGGAWIVIVLIPGLVFLFSRIHTHYHNVARLLSTRSIDRTPEVHALQTIVLVDDVHRGTIRVVEFAKSLGDNWYGVHIAYDDRKTEAVERKWHHLIGGELHIVQSPYRRLVDSVIEFVMQARAQVGANGFVHVVMGQLVMDTAWARTLHANNAFGIMAALQRIEGVIVSEVPYQLHAEDVAKFPENVYREREFTLSGEGNDESPTPVAAPDDEHLHT